MSSPKSTFIPYSPASPPTAKDQNTCRATWDEFFKLQQSFIDADRPVSLAATKSELMPVQAAAVWTRLFDPAVVEWEAPLGQLAATGVWSAPQEGLYQITVIIEIPAFPQPGARLYEATLRSTFAGSSAATLLSKSGGPDEAPLRLVANFLRPMSRGDTVLFDLDLTEVAYTGNVTTFAILNVVRMSGTR